jgi:ATP-binding cassette subfamily B protein
MKQNTKLTLRFFWKYVKKHWVLGLAGFIGVTLGVLASMAFPYYLKLFVDALSEGGTKEQLLGLFGIMAALSFFEWAMWRIGGYTMSIMEPRGMREIADHCFEVLHRHSFNFFNNQFVGSLVKRVSRMTRAFEDVLDQVLWAFYPLFLRVLIVVVVLSLMNALLGVIVFVWVLAFLFIHYSISKYKHKKYDLPLSEADTKTTAYLADTITNNSTIKLFAKLPHEQKMFAKVTDAWSQRFTKSWIFSNHVDALQGLFTVVLELVILYIAIGLWEAGTLTVGDFFLIQAYLMELFRHVWDFGRELRHLYEHLADAEEMTVILQTPFEIVDAPNAKKLNVKKGEVKFDAVSFSYTDDEESSVVKDLSFTVKAGERIALIGPSGGGKTTIIKLILRLFDVDKGSVLVDGQDIAQVTQESLHKNIALVPQDPILFHRTLMDNIRYGNLTASDEEVYAAAKLAHCHEFISKFPQGYQTFVGERGVKLSGGERQRVAIARAILANTRILILDEATSSLDSESEKLIKDALHALMKNKTVFVIAHRLSTIIDMDRILVLEAGKIVEEGRHVELSKKEGGLYKKLWDLQVGGYLA